MDQDIDNAAAEAFEGLRGEVALLRRAVERLAAERADTLDYTETLAHTDRAMTALVQRVDILAKSPALSLTPETAAAQITAAAAKARADDQRLIDAARAGLDQATRQLDTYVTSARRSHEQNRWLLGVGAGSMALGMLLWAALAGPVDRAVPERWHWPEKRAAQVLGRPMWQAGLRLIATASPAAFRAAIAADRLVQANREVIAGCADAAAKAHAAVRCTIKIEIAP